MQVEKVEYTGERIIPGAGPEFFFQEHLSRYKYFCGLLNGSDTVLDAGCGEGYGSNLISGHAGKVVGIDISAVTIQTAGRKYNRANLRYFPSDGKRMALKPGLFDICCSFEVFEHISNVGDYLSEIRRVLKPGGKLIVSTPNRETYPMAGLNPYHVKEYTLTEFKECLSPHFRIEAILGQSCKAESRQLYSSLPAKVVIKIKRAFGIKNLFPEKMKSAIEKMITGKSIQDVKTEDFEISEQNLANGEYFIAVVTKADSDSENA